MLGMTAYPLEAGRRKERKTKKNGRANCLPFWKSFFVFFPQTLRSGVRLTFFRQIMLKTMLKTSRPSRSSAPVIALVGCDGSGKSTVGQALLETLRHERPIRAVHLGKQSGNLQRAVEKLPFIGALLKRQAQHEKRRTNAKRPPSPQALTLVALFTLKRWVRYLKMRYWHARGYAIIADRYPHAGRPGLMDGPRLPGRVPGGRVQTLLERVECLCYEHMARFTPDLVIRLNVDPQTAAQRKPDHNPERLAYKISRLSQLPYDAPLVDIDATQPLEDVVAQALAAVSTHIGRRDSAAPSATFETNNRAAKTVSF